MRWRERLVLASALVLALGGCSRLSFVKPDASRRGVERVAPDYQFKETSAGKRRSEARHQVSVANRHLQAGELAQAERAAQAALRVAGLENLLAAGMMITSDHDAHMSTRNTVACMGQGQAAGTAAALCAERDCGTRDLPYPVLREALEAAGVYFES